MSKHDRLCFHDEFGVCICGNLERRDAAIRETVAKEIEQDIQGDDCDICRQIARDADIARRGLAAVNVTCYSDHDEDIRTKGACDYCGDSK